MKLFKVKDTSGRGFGYTTMNQTQLFNFIDAGTYEKDLISNLRKNESTDDIPAVFIIRIK
jgi:hypothetical protein